MHSLCRWVIYVNSFNAETFKFFFFYFNLEKPQTFCMVTDTNTEMWMEIIFHNDILLPRCYNSKGLKT